MLRAMAISMITVACLAGGCAKPAGVVFPPLEQPVAWPGPPDPPRIAYVGQIQTNEDLKPARKFFEGLGQALFGKKPIQGLLSPYAVCTDEKDRLFVADNNGQIVHVFNLGDRVYQQWAPPPEAPRYTQPVGLAYDIRGGRLLVADSMSAAIFAFNDQGTYIGQLGVGELQRPCGIAIDRRNGRIFVADVMAHQIVVLSPDGQMIQRLGQRGADLGEFNFPTNVAVDSQGRLYVSDSLNFRIQQFSPELKPIRQIGRLGNTPGCFSQPKGIAVDRDDHVYVVDARFENVQIFDSEGRLLLDFGEEGQGPGQFWLPAGIYIDANNRIWVADSYNRRVEAFDYLPEKQP